MPLLIVIVGPTAIGKTDLAIRLAQHLGTEIISADSRQFFKEMSIGTAKPDSVELNLIKHHFINSHSIQDEFSVGNFEQEGLKLIAKATLPQDDRQRGGGGTHSWLRSGHRSSTVSGRCLECVDSVGWARSRRTDS